MPGRNDPCPCGSGKKFKKCCLGKTAPLAEPAIATAVEPRFHPVALSYYTSAALAEAHKPGAIVRIHPYVMAKLREDPRLIEAAHPSDRPRLMRIWRPSKLTALSRQDIKSRLDHMGVRFDEAALRESAQPWDSAWAIGLLWGAPLEHRSPMDVEFLGLAACELWRRLAPDRPSVEMLDDWLCEGYSLEAEGKHFEALSAWWRVWEALRLPLSTEWNDLQQLNDGMFRSMSQHLSNWDVDFQMAALNGSDPRCAEIGIRYLQELCAASPEDEQLLFRQGNLGMLLFNQDRYPEAEQCCRRMIQEHPDRAAGYVTCAGGWLRDSWRGAVDPEKVNRAIELLQQAQDYPVTDPTEFDLAKRLQDARALLANPPR